jgi:translation initiation factor IF-2
MPQRKLSPQRGMVGRKSIMQTRAPLPDREKEKKKLEVVVKCDSAGSVEAVISLLAGVKTPSIEIKVFHFGVGSVSKSDLLMALNGSRLVLGFNVEVMPKLEQWIKEHDVEVRLYEVIYKLSSDIRDICLSFEAREAEEKISGKAKVIALFKSRPGAIILGCEVLEGTLAVGRDFRIISAMGPVYTGKIGSLQIEKRGVKEVTAGQRAGIKISDFNQARIGDLVECFERAQQAKHSAWKPSGSIISL